MQELEIREATSKDVRLISALSITTCFEAYFALDTSEDIADYCANFYSHARIRKELEDNNSRYFVAEFKGNACGFIKLRRGNRIEPVETLNAIEIQRIYLLEQLKGRGIGRAMLEFVFHFARERDIELVWLGVWEKNISAIEFYSHMEMENLGMIDFFDGKNDFVNIVYAKSVSKSE